MIATELGINIVPLIGLVFIMGCIFLLGCEHGRKTERTRLLQKIRNARPYEDSWGVQRLDSGYFAGYFNEVGDEYKNRG